MFGGHFEVVKYLLPIFGPSKFDFDSRAQTCLHKAAKEGHSKILRFLIEEQGFDPNLTDQVSIVYMFTFIALVANSVFHANFILARYSDAAMLPHCVHNVSSLLRAIGVIGLEYPTHCCTHSPNVCRMTWTASCWLVPMGGWGLCRSW